jgi:hypothetical protein
MGEDFLNRNDLKRGQRKNLVWWAHQLCTYIMVTHMKRYINADIYIYIYILKTLIKNCNNNNSNLT